MCSVDQHNKALWCAIVELCLGPIKYSFGSGMWLRKKTVWVVWGCKGPWSMDGKLLIDLWVIFIITNSLTLNIS